MAQWFWDTKNHRYVSDAGRVLTDRELLALRNAVADGMSAESAGLATKLANGVMTLLEWASAFAKLLTHGITAGFLLGHGGRAQMDAKASATLDGLIGAQHTYARGFVRDLAARINDGTLTEAGVAARSGLYAGAAVHAYEISRSSSWEISIPFAPADGGTPCLGACRCWWEFSETDTEYTATYYTRDDSRVCDGCQAREGQYGAGSPYTVAKHDEELGGVAA